MKTAISLPDQLFKAGETLAGRLGLTRSRLYCLALEEFIARHSANRVSERLDAVYSVERSELDPALTAMQVRMVKGTDW